MRCVIDSSVWVSAALPNEANHASSAKFLRAVQDAKTEVICPDFTLVECAAAIARRTGNSAHASGLVALMRQFPRIKVIGSSSDMMNQAMEIAQRQRLRAGDAIHLAVSQMFKAILVTLDEEIIDKSGFGKNIVKPENWTTQNNQ